MPQGSARGYKTVGFVGERANPFNQNPSGMDSPEFNRAIRDAIAAEFTRHGISTTQDNPQLLYAFMVIRQNNVATTVNQQYFGFGRDASAIMDEAHRRGVIGGKTPTAFDMGAVVVDVLDTRTNKLIFRGFAKRPVTEGLDPSARRSKINSAVAEAMAPFFR